MLFDFSSDELNKEVPNDGNNAVERGATVGDLFKAAVTNTDLVESSDIRQNILLGAERTKRDELYQSIAGSNIYKDAGVPNPTLDVFRRTDEADVARGARLQPHQETRIKKRQSDQQILDTFIADARVRDPDRFGALKNSAEFPEILKQRRVEAQQEASRTNQEAEVGGGTKILTSLAGGIVGSFKDPHTLFTSVAGAPRGASLARTAVVEFAVGAAAEAGLDADVTARKIADGQEVTLKERLFNILVGGTAGAALGTGAAALGKLRGRNKGGANPDSITPDADGGSKSLVPEQPTTDLKTRGRDPEVIENTPGDDLDPSTLLDGQTEQRVVIDQDGNPIKEVGSETSKFRQKPKDVNTRKNLLDEADQLDQIAIEAREQGLLDVADTAQLAADEVRFTEGHRLSDFSDDFPESAHVAVERAFEEASRTGEAPNFSKIEGFDGDYDFDQRLFDDEFDVPAGGRAEPRLTDAEVDAKIKDGAKVEASKPKSAVRRAFDAIKNSEPRSQRVRKVERSLEYTESRRFFDDNLTELESAKLEKFTVQESIKDDQVGISLSKKELIDEARTRSFLKDITEICGVG